MLYFGDRLYVSLSDAISMRRSKWSVHHCMGRKPVNVRHEFAWFRRVKLVKRNLPVG
jgi:hypothetical protein